MIQDMSPVWGRSE